MNYNLLDEKWIPVLYHNGNWERIGLRKALNEAGAIRQIAASNPMDRVAILRFLLALLYWCKGNPPDDACVNPRDPFPAEWFSKLDQNHECFNLLGGGKRFYQDGAYRGKKAEHTTNYLIHEVPSGTNKWHFRHSTDKVDGLCPACCAMGLIRLPLFATSGGKGMTASSGKSPGINSKPPIYFLPLGRSLASTLRLLWQTRSIADMGTPEWETPNLQLPRRGEVPFMTGLTWLPRRVWLGDPEEPVSACISCGSTERLIRSCVFDGKGSSKAEDRVWRDPHVLYFTSLKGDIVSLHAGDALGASDAAAGHWAKIAAGMLKGNMVGKGENSIWVVAFSSVQNDKYLEAMEATVSSPTSLNQIQLTIEKIDRWQKESHAIIRKLTPNDEKNSSRKHVEVPSLIAAVRPEIEKQVSTKNSALISGVDGSWEQAAQEYRPMMEVVAKSISPGCTSSAVQRRREIAGLMPDMNPNAPQPAKKANRKKGAIK